jgi:hypothetical protein
VSVDPAILEQFLEQPQKEFVEGPVQQLVREGRPEAAPEEALPGGTRVPGEVIVDQPLDETQERPDVFLRRLAQEVLTVTPAPGIPGHGEEREFLVEQIVDVLRRGHEICDRDRTMTLEAWFRMTFDIGQPVASAAELRGLIVHRMDGSQVFEAMRAVAQLTQEEREDRYTPDTESDPSVGSGFPLGIDDVIAALDAFKSSAPATLSAAGVPVVIRGPPRLAPPRPTYQRNPALVFQQFLAAGREALLAPPGSMRPSAADGQIVHLAVQEAYRAQHPGHLVCADRRVYAASRGAGMRLGRLARGQTIYTALDLAQRSIRGAALRADIVDFTPGVMAMYEIKPRAQAARGVVQLWAYIWAFNMLTELMGLGEGFMGPGTHWNLGAPAFIVPLPGGRFAVPFTRPGMPGLILYDVFRRPQRRRARRRQESRAQQPQRSWVLDPQAALEALALALLIAILIAVLILAPKFGIVLAAAVLVFVLMDADPGPGMGSTPGDLL